VTRPVTTGTSGAWDRRHHRSRMPAPETKGRDGVDALARTRLTLHRLAETVLAGPQYRAVGTIRLVVRPGGFATSRPYGAVELVAVEGTHLLVVRSGRHHRLPLAGTYGELASAAGLPLERLDDVYAGAAGVRPAQLVDVDAAAAAQLAAAWELGDRALRAFVAPSPAAPVLWPEHLDVAVTADGSTYGVSPGDDLVAEPYAYVAPGRALGGGFWNQPFGAARPVGELRDERSMVAFYGTGRELAAGSTGNVTI
jgi:hypothetical protein